MDRTADLVVLVSGSGTNLQALIDAIDAGALKARIGLVVSNRPDAFALERAQNAGIETAVLEPGTMERPEYDSKLADLVASVDPDLVVLAGWNRILSSVFLASQLVINLHPALPGTFVGLGCIKKAFVAWEAGEVDRSGVMVHWVPDEGVDTGPVIESHEVLFVEDDSLESFTERIHAAEHIALVNGVSRALAELGV